MLKNLKRRWQKEDREGSFDERLSETTSEDVEQRGRRSTSRAGTSTPGTNTHMQLIADDASANNVTDSEESGHLHRKRRKTSTRPSTPVFKEAIATRLPEIVDEKYKRSSQEDEKAGIIEYMKEGNTLIIMDSELGKVEASCSALLWASDTEKAQFHEINPSRPFRKKKIALVIAEDVASASSRAVQITTIAVSKGSLHVGVYTPNMHKTPLESWRDIITKDVVITTANLLLESLEKGAFAISQVHIMVIDDALALRNNDSHPIQKIMLNYYRVTERLSRPKVLGIVLPPPDTKLYFDTSLIRIEHLLSARFKDVSESVRNAIMSLPEKPTEIVIFYDAQTRAADTQLQTRLRKFDPQMSIFPSHFRNARHALGELGACACDLVWLRALKQMELEHGNDEPVFEEEEELQPGSEAAIRKAKSNIISAIKNHMFTIPNLDPTSRQFNVTPKLVKLMDILKTCQSEAGTFRGIIFVQKRSIAFVLSDLIRALDDRVGFQRGFLRSQTLVGNDKTTDSNSTASILEEFATGQVNLLIATKHAEDLDIAPASLIVRFDLFESQVSYAYCRARSRGHECHLVHMAERGNDIHRRILTQIARSDPRMERWLHRLATKPTSSIPPDNLRETVDPYRSDSEDEDNDPTKFVQDPTTSGRIYEQDATTVVYRIAAQLNSGMNEESESPLFEFQELPGIASSDPIYICTVLLPGDAPIKRVSGPPCESKALARRTACYQTCVELYKRGMLDYRLFPRPPLPRTRPLRATYISTQMVEELSDREADEQLLPQKTKQGQNKTSGTRPYNRKRPAFWDSSLPIMRGCLYPVIMIPCVNPETIESEGKFSPMLLLTRLPLPPLSAMSLFFPSGAGKMHFQRAAAVEVDEDQLQDLCKYTIRVARYITNKPHICALERMPYFFAPLRRDARVDLDTMKTDEGLSWTFPSVTNDIPWDEIRLAASRPLTSLNTQDLATLSVDTEDAMVQDRWTEFTRRYYCIRMRPDLSPLSKPVDSEREKGFENFVEYCRARRKGFTELENEKQPLIEVQRNQIVINHLNPSAKPAVEKKIPAAKYLIPELCAKCTLPASIYRTASLLPSVLTRLDDILLVKELNARYFDHAITERHLHAAISAPSASVEFDYERLELLGDAYLKYLSSIYLFVTFPTLNEGALHVSRQRIISNRSLLRNSNLVGLPQYIQSRPFTIKAWHPPNFILYRPQKTYNDEGPAEPEQAIEEDEHPDANGAHNKRLEPLEDPPSTKPMDVVREPDEMNEKSGTGGIKETKTSKKKFREESANIQWIGDKAVADVAEAIIGAAYVTGGRETALRVTKAINIPVPHVDRWTDFGRKALAPPPEVTAKLKPGSIEAVESIIGHKFDHPHLLAQALTHASIHMGNGVTSYERLEFIGDAILDFLVIRHIFDRDSGLSPGALTLLKGAMVSNVTLAAVCVWCGLHEYLLFESGVLEESILAYADQLKEQQKRAYEQASRENRPPGQYWVEIEPPKALSDVVESILGAVYVSDNFAPTGAEKFFDKVLAPFYDQHITLHTLAHHPTKVLFELFQSQGCQGFEIVKESLDPASNEHGHSIESKVLVHDVVLTSATDVSATAAARRASDLALDAIEGDPLFMSRTCDCRIQNLARKAAKKAQKGTSLNGEEAEEQLVEGVLSTLFEE